MKSPDLTTDMLIHSAHEVESTHCWVDDRIADCGHDEHLGALDAAVGDLRRAAEEFTHYSDGRPVMDTVEVERGHTFTYLFKAIIEHRGERLLFEALRLADPDEADRGRYRVYVDDRAATVRVELIGPGRRLKVVEP